MPTIRQLPPILINKIAAGEVIERPASVVKELLENSVDAGASRIEVTIEKGGEDLIRISDNGCGIAAEQLPLAIASHATSKLPDDDTLFAVRTLGFRGEALASIASISHLLIRSRPTGEDAGAEIQVRGGSVEGPAPCAAPVGTIIEVRNLFFNTPVRRKFLRSSTTEMGHITEAFTRIALAYPQVHFRLVSGGREVYDLPATTRWADRLAAFFGNEIADTLIRVEGDDGQVKLHGYVCDPSVNRANNRMQYLFLNGRHIRDRALQHALGEAYRGLLMVGRFPVCFLHLDLPPEMVDVNVHPTKLEVRFTDSGRIYGKLLQTLRHTFLSSDLTARVRGSNSDAVEALPASTALGTAAIPAVPLAEMPRQQQIAWSPLPAATTAVDLERLGRPGVPAFRPFPESRSMISTTAGAPAARRASWSDLPPWEQPAIAPVSTGTGGTAERQDHAVDGPPPMRGSSFASSATSNMAPSAEVAADLMSPSLAGRLGLQVHNRYLITQDDRGMVVIDQHALHERILYERIREKVLGGQIETQRLLVPEPVTLTPAEAAAALENAELLGKVGLEIEPFGGDAVLVRSYPAMLGNVMPGELLRQSLESLLAAGKDPEIRDLLDHLLHTIACKAAIKAGDRLTGEEITALLEQRHLYQDTHHCPHGRPTALYFSRDELDRMFGRLGPRKSVLSS